MSESVRYPCAEWQAASGDGRRSAVSTRADLAHRIAEIVKQRGLQPVQMAALVKVEPADARAILAGRIAGFSQERLTEIWSILCRRSNY